MLSIVKANNLLSGLLAFSIIACNQVRGGSPFNLAGDREKTHSFVLPVLPETLTEPRARADYLITHYWDHYDFTDTALIHMPVVSEQAFVDYLDIMPHAGRPVVLQSIEQTLVLAGKEKSRKMYTYFLDLFEKYLYNTDSPFRNDEYYIPVLEHIISDKHSSESEKLRPSYRLSMMRKNRVGTKASDLTYTLPSGVKGHLYGTEADYMLLMFYNPGCRVCEDLITALHFSPTIRSEERRKKIKILALYGGDNLDAWRKYKDEIPADWINGYTGTQAEEQYELRTIPCIYVLDKDKTVLLKEADYTALEKWWKAFFEL
ncbi:MAG: DUF5106 domain-containing protein [Dysgonamonadaceae bacterium]|jgi:hypothetical protein|nr:DUF5106 domain-containing protein [Dysgonamonadaceae bacterium]